MGDPAVLVPSGLAKIHPGLETSIKSIATAIQALQKKGASAADGSSTAITSQLQEVLQQLQSLQQQVEALPGGVVYRAASPLGAFNVIYQVSPGVAAVADATGLATSCAVIGITTTTAATGSAVAYAGVGETVTNNAWTWSPGAVFLGAAGSLTQTVPEGSFPILVGYAASVNSVLVGIEGPFVPLLASATDPAAVSMYFNSDDGTLRYRSGSSFIRLGTLDQISAAVASVNLNNQVITDLANPVNPQDAVNLQTLQSWLAKLSDRSACAYATTAALPENTYSNGSGGLGAALAAKANGVLTIDGQMPAVGMRVLVMNEAMSGNNGIYSVIQAGSGSTPWMLMRTDDADTASELGPGLIVAVEAPSGFMPGGVNNGLVLISLGPSPFVVGTSGITFTAIGGIYSAGTGLTLTGKSLSITNTGVNAGNYGDASHVPQITINAQGQITSASNVVISGGGSSGESGLQVLASASVRADLDGATYNYSSSSPVAIDSTNLTVTFNAPESGKVMISLEAVTGQTEAGAHFWLLLDEFDWPVADTETIVNSPNSGNNAVIRIHNNCNISGLIPGASYTYRWGWLDASDLGSSSLYTGPTYGSADMIVVAVNKAAPATISAGLFASLPSSPLGGQMYKCTDAPAELLYQGGAWLTFHNGQLVAPYDDGTFSWVNQGSATISALGPFSYLKAPATAGDDFALKTKALNVPYTFTAWIKPDFVAVNFFSAGIVIYDSTSGSFIVFGVSTPNAPQAYNLQVIEMNSVTSFNNGLLNVPLPLANCIWLQISEDGATRTFSYSMDGANFQSVLSHASGTFITPNEAGFAVNPHYDGSPVYQSSMLILSSNL